MAPALDYCPEKQRLIRAFTEAAAVYLRLESAQLAAVIDGRRFEGENELRKAREREAAIKQAIIEHQLAHKC